MTAMRDDRRRPSSTSPAACSATSSLELHWIAFDLLERTIVEEPERAWQLLRAEAARAPRLDHGGPLAHVAGRGILAEPYRWAELEQLVYSPSRWERRLVGSTIATIPHSTARAGREPDVARHGLPLARATSSATPSPTSRRPSPGRSAR